MDGRRIALTTGTLASVALAMAVVSAAGPGAAATTSSTLSIDIAAMAYHSDATEDGVCGPMAPQEEREFDGTESGPGTYIASVNLPQGARVTALRLTARDNDTDREAHAYLVRKLMVPQTGVDGFGGYKVMARVHSNGASTALRRFSTGAIVASAIDPSGYSYLVEIVNCVDTVDPIGVQIAYIKS